MHGGCGLVPRRFITESVRLRVSCAGVERLPKDQIVLVLQAWIIHHNFKHDLVFNQVWSGSVLTLVNSFICLKSKVLVLFLFFLVWYHNLAWCILLIIFHARIAWVLFDVNRLFLVWSNIELGLCHHEWVGFLRRVVQHSVRNIFVYEWLVYLLSESIAVIWSLRWSTFTCLSRRMQFSCLDCLLLIMRAHLLRNRLLNVSRRLQI